MNSFITLSSPSTFVLPPTCNLLSGSGLVIPIPKLLLLLLLPLLYKNVINSLLFESLNVVFLLLLSVTQFILNSFITLSSPSSIVLPPTCNLLPGTVIPIPTLLLLPVIKVLPSSLIIIFDVPWFICISLTSVCLTLTLILLLDVPDVKSPPIIKAVSNVPSVEEAISMLPCTVNLLSPLYLLKSEISLVKNKRPLERFPSTVLSFQFCNESKSILLNINLLPCTATYFPSALP